CVDKTGTLTDGTLDLVSVEVADKTQPAAAHEALAAFAHSAGERNRTLETIADRYPGTPGRVVAEVPFSSAWKWSGVTLDGGGPVRSYVMGAPDVLTQAGALELPPALARTLEEHSAAGRRVVAFGEAHGALPEDPGTEPPPKLEPRALVVLEEQLRSDAAETIEFMRDQNVDLKLISGDARLTVTAVAHAVGVPAAPADHRRDADDRDPVVRPRPRAERRASLQGPPAAGPCRVRGPRGGRDRGRLAALLLPGRRHLRRLARRGPDRCDHDAD